MLGKLIICLLKKKKSDTEINVLQIAFKGKVHSAEDKRETTEVPPGKFSLQCGSLL